MPKFLTISSLTQSGLQGTLMEGGTARREAIRKATEGVGGRLEAFYYGFGDHDVYAIVDVPSNIDAATASMTIGAAGVAHSSTVVLITPEEMDQVSKRAAETSSTYRAPST